MFSKEKKQDFNYALGFFSLQKALIIGTDQGYI